MSPAWLTINRDLESSPPFRCGVHDAQRDENPDTNRDHSWDWLGEFKPCQPAEQEAPKHLPWNSTTSRRSSGFP